MTTINKNTEYQYSVFFAIMLDRKDKFLIMDIHFNPIAFWGLLILAIILAAAFVWFTRDKWFGDSVFRFIVLFLILAIILGVMANLIFMFGLGVSYTPIFDDVKTLISKVL